MKFKNQHRMLVSFGAYFLVVCPNCSGKAKVISLGAPSPYITGITRRFFCSECGSHKEFVPRKNCYNEAVIRYSKNWEEGYINIGGPFDWFFGYSLYLQIPCCGQTLWAYNLEHLEYVESYVAAELREDHPYYLSVESRLPAWMKSAKNRHDVLKAIGKLKIKESGLIKS
ncbi:hypothetical protein [Paenibacillus fonticola]|uniref:hypothetical protein n=1 Tax=Paenibacillus fonticola TaxID=379896 RepID=UPI00036D5E7D|nr:hypothetical protein [Paenibacillus fonticola]